MTSPVHVRTQIRDKVIALLTGLATTQGRVRSGRTRPLGAAYKPTLMIYTRDERSAVDAMLGEVVERRLQLFVEGRVVAAEPPDDLLDRIALEVETRIGANQTLGGLVKAMALTASPATSDAEGESHYGVIRLTWDVVYVTAEGAPGAAL